MQSGVSKKSDTALDLWAWDFDDLMATIYFEN